MSLYDDRRQAGRVLAGELSEYTGRDDVVVLALPRGGVPVAYEVATRLRAPLDVMVVRKLGVPGREELAMGAIASGGVLFLNEELIDELGIPKNIVDAVVSSEAREVARRERAYRSDRPPVDVTDQTIILIDDGLATGSTMKAAVASLRRRGPKRIVVAVPIAAPSTCDELASDVDELVCAVTPEPFYAVGVWYDDFSQTTDDEVRELLETADGGSGPAAHHGHL